MAVPPGNRLGWRRSLGDGSPIIPSALPAKVAILYSEKRGKTIGLNPDTHCRFCAPAAALLNSLLPLTAAILPEEA
jgi:hypothetical protein